MTLTNRNRWFDLYWEKQLYNSGLTDRDIELWKERRKLDRECSVEKEVDRLIENIDTDLPSTR